MKRQRIANIIHRSPRAQRESGYIVLFVIITLAALLAMSSQFLDRSVASMKIADYNRSSSESLLLAESAANWLFGTWDSGGTYGTMEINHEQLTFNVDNIDLSKTPFIYYIRENNSARLGVPDILQRVANGEALKKGGAISERIVDSESKTLSIADVIKNGKPIILERKENSFKPNPNLDWEKSSNPRAIVWMELVLDPTKPSRALIYIQAVGIFGNARSYVQRYAASIDDTMNIGGGSPFLGANPT